MGRRDGLNFVSKMIDFRLAGQCISSYKVIVTSLNANYIILSPLLLSKYEYSPGPRLLNLVADSHLTSYHPVATFFQGFFIVEWWIGPMRIMR